MISSLPPDPIDTVSLALLACYRRESDIGCQIVGRETTAMDLTAFKSSLNQETPPDLPVPLQALWQDAKGDWTAAHDLLQGQESGDGAWVHAYLHRKEGDISNASYWYRKAGKPVASSTLDEEWDSLAEALLSQS